MKKFIECSRSLCDVKIPIDRCVNYKEGEDYVCNTCLKEEHSPTVYAMFKDLADEIEDSATTKECCMGFKPDEGCNCPECDEKRC